MQHLRRMEDRVVLLTGGGGGIARGVARAFADEGAKMILTDIFPGGMERTKAELEHDFGTEVFTCVADGSKEDEVKEAVEKGAAHFGKLNVLINSDKERLSYDCIGIRAADENNGEYHLSVLNNKFYKLPTNTKVDIKKYIKIKDSKVENRNFTISELGNILKEMYSNAENKMQVASIHIFGIKYGKNIIQKAFKSLDIVKAAGINESYSTELQKALNIYRCLEQNSYDCFLLGTL